MAEKRERWRMTLVELCHASKAMPADLNLWASLGAFGPEWRVSTENKWRHVTKAVARRAVVMRHLLESGIPVETAALMADSSADRLAKGETLSYGDGMLKIDLDPAGMDLP